MKNFIFSLMMIFAAAALGSCNDRFEGDEIQSTAAAKVDSVKIAQYTMDVFTIQTIKTYSTYSSQCEGFFGYDYLHTQAFEREVVPFKFKTNNACGNPVARASVINFRPQQVGTYKFKFWTGEDSNGNDIWHEETIVVQ